VQDLGASSGDGIVTGSPEVMQNRTWQENMRVSLQASLPLMKPAGFNSGDSTVMILSNLDIVVGLSLHLLNALQWELNFNT
jgi:hypothetical protein